MDDTRIPRGGGCLICLIQASDSMRETAFAGPVATKIDAALGVVGRLLGDLAGEASADGRSLDVGVLTYSTRDDGKPRLRPLLAGAAADRPLVPLETLARIAADGEAVRIEAKTSGRAPARAALAYTTSLLARWIAEHPGTSPPIVVHCTEGESSDGPIVDSVRSLIDAVPGVVIVHCLFRRGTTPSALIPIPETPCGDLWAMSSPYPVDEAGAPAGADAPRSLFVNKLASARAIGRLVRRLWAGTPPAAAGAAPEDVTPFEVEIAPEAETAIATDAEGVAEPAPPPEAAPAVPPRLEYRALWMPKRGNQESEWEDGDEADVSEGIVAVTDGASDGIFSKLWGDLLRRAFVARPVALDDPEAVEPWIQERRREWFGAIRYPEQRWSIQMKIDRSCGAATFLGLRLDPPGPDEEASVGWTAWAVGDICLFHIRGGELIASFPLAASAEFNATPVLYQSKAMRPTPRALVTRGEFGPGDLIVLATDATAQRLLAEVEAGTPPDWGRFWDLDQEEWRGEIEALRDCGAIVNDDCTLVVVRRPGSDGAATDTKVAACLEVDDEPSVRSPSGAADEISPSEAPGGAETEPDPSRPDRVRGPVSIPGIVLIGLVLAALSTATAAQEAASQPEGVVIKSMLARLRSACESDVRLRGAFVQDGTLGGGRLRLSGTVDRAEQVGEIEAEGRSLLEANPPWMERITGGIDAAGLVVFPIRSELLPRLRGDFARADGPPGERPGLAQHTRIDDLFFDARGRLRVVGLCIDPGAYLAVRKAGEDRADDPRPAIAQAVRDRLRQYPPPRGVAPKAISRILADKVVFEPNPVRRLQQWANDARLDDLLFRDARFDAAGALTIDGLIGDESQRVEAAAMVARPEVVRTYARPGGAAPSEPRAAVAAMKVVPWRKELLAGLQDRFARDANRGTSRDPLRYCRVDRAAFVYPARGGPSLLFEGVALRPDDSGRIRTGIRDECHRLFLKPQGIQCVVQARLTALPDPVPPLQKAVAAEPALDGVRLDDLGFGPRGEPTFEGRWIGPSQAATLSAVVMPALARLTGGRVVGSPVWRLREAPTDGLLRGLRRRVAGTFRETSLDRLVYLPAGEPGARPALTLQGAAPWADRDRVAVQLAAWLAADELAKSLDSPVVVRLAARPGSLLQELRRRVADDLSLDGVRVDRADFDEENSLILAGLEDHDGQADRVAGLVRDAAAVAWCGLPAPAEVRVGSFLVYPLQPLLDRVRRALPAYAQADGVLVNRVHYDADSALAFAGITTGRAGRRPDLEVLIESRILNLGPAAGRVRLSLAPRPPDPEAVDRTISRAIGALSGGGLAGFDRDALDEAVLLSPSRSIAWYLRGAYYHAVGDRELAMRDFGRVHAMEAADRGRARERHRALERFQGASRVDIENLLAEARAAR